MKHLLTTAGMTRADAIRILDTAAQMEATQEREIRKLPTLRGKTVVNLFFEDSTRTRISFEAAAKRLSADVINFSAKGSSVSKGESLKDTALTLQAMGADAVVVRHWASGAAELLATSGWIHGSVLNAGDGTHQHPTQALLDAYTIRKHLVGAPDGAGLDGLRVAIVGDILHSRVARIERLPAQHARREGEPCSPADALAGWHLALAQSSRCSTRSTRRSTRTTSTRS